MASYGGIKLINMGPGNEWKCGDLNLENEYQNVLESHIMLGFSGVSRYAEDLSKKQVENIKRGDNYHYLKEMMELTDTAIHSLWKHDDMSVIGNHLQEGWKIKRQLYDGISDLWIDEIYNEQSKGNVKAVIATFGTKPEALLDIVSGKFNPTGKMPFTTPISEEQAQKQAEEILDWQNELQVNKNGGYKKIGRAHV